SWEAVPIEAVVQKVSAMARWVRSRGVGKGDRVLILSESRLEWAMADLAVLSVGGVVVPIYPTLPANQIAPLLADSGASAAFVSSAAQRAKLEEAATGARSSGGGNGVNGANPLRWVHTFDEDPWPTAVTGAVDPNVPLHPDDLASIIYTSGTTGEPK